MKKIQLQVPQPCQEAWHQMTPRSNGRYCNSCQKTVIDFSTMNDAALLQFFQKPNSNVCGRFAQHQLQRPLEAPKKSWPLVRYFFQITLPALLLSMRSPGASKPFLTPTTQQEQLMGDTIITDSIVLEQPVLASGVVRDEKGNRIPYATLMLQFGNSGVQCDSGGLFEVRDTELFQKAIVVSAIGYTSKPIQLDKDTSSPIEIVLNNNSEDSLVGFLGGAVVTTVCRKPSKPIPLIPTRAASPESFSVFPNPAPAGTSVSIKGSQLRRGSYQLVLQTATGQQVWQTKIGFEKAANALSVQLPTVPAGLYVITLVPQKSGNALSQKLEIH